ncbi:apolipoprotein N-acyltransferase [Neptunomonas sp. XY-337]|uniref:apolipoprotein N-acyltransferase n=1 Tax=Neptunomonas sp. XY-337 TaxID=2561897 RepID=UPI0010AAB1F7|nr:apolipoprotein N-acyltransferase [Neptunomonas sp. XY-337]
MRKWLLNKRCGFALLAGAITPLAFAPFHLWPIALISPAILFWLIRYQAPTPAFWTGWSFGAGLFGTGVSWVYVSISQFSATPALLAAAMTAVFVATLALFFATQSWLYARLNQPYRYGALTFIGLWVLFEWLRGWLFTGFPWLLQGYPLLDSPLRAWAPIGGIWLLSFIAVAISVACACLYNAKSRRQRGWIALGLSACLGTFLLPSNWTQSVGNPHSVAVVQANIPQDMKWDKRYLPEIIDRYIQLTAEHTDAELIIWPETAVPEIIYNAEPMLAAFLSALESQDRTLISGIPSIEFDRSHPDGYRVHNSLSVLTGIMNTYHKQRLVPFGEYVPFEKQVRGLTAFFDLPMSSFSLPPADQKPLFTSQHKIAAAICYEIAYPELVAASAQQADWILTVSNDTWFSHTLAPAQHLQIAQLRALENGRWIVRSTNNGITALINHHGEITESIPSYQEGVLRGEIERREGLTPYQRWGNMPTLLASLALVLVSAVRLRRTKSS